MISAEKPSRPPDSATAAVAPPCAHREAPARFLNGFSSSAQLQRAPWENPRLLSSVKMSGDGETAGSMAEAAPTGDPGYMDDVGLGWVREKLLVQLRDAADRMKLVVPQPQLPPQPQPQQQSTGPWKLRERRGRPMAPVGIEAPAVEKRAMRLRSEEPPRPKFSICLTREEIDEDIYAVTGRQARRRPRKRPRVVQKQLDSLFPGSWLAEVTVDLYRVPE